MSAATVANGKTIRWTAALTLASNVLVALIGVGGTIGGLLVINALDRNEVAINEVQTSVDDTQEVVEQVHVATNSALDEVKEALRLAQEQIAAGAADRALLRSEIVALQALIREMRDPSVEPLSDEVDQEMMEK